MAAKDTPVAMRRFLQWQSTPPVVINLVLSAAVAWMIFKDLPVVPLRGSLSVGADTLFTAFVLPVLICLVTVTLVRKKMAAGRAPELGQLADQFWLRGIHSSSFTFRHSLAFGVLGVMLVGVPVLCILMASVLSDMSLYNFVLYKAVLAAVLAALTAPVSVLIALKP